MSFYDMLQQYRDVDVHAFFASVQPADVQRALSASRLTPEEYLVLLSPMAGTMLEQMAQRAHQLTLQHFGKTIQLFTPLYLSNYCTNQCVYCGFNTKNTIQRMQLTLDEVREEGRAIAATGLKHLLILTGEAPKKASLEYIRQCAEVLREFFPSISIEVYALATHQYELLARSGVDGLTIYQETYNEERYAVLHPTGPKQNFRHRLDAPERGCIAGMRTVNIGALLGLDDWYRDAFLTGLHAHYLQHAYPETDIAVSLPRMRPHAGEFQPATVTSDRELVQTMLAQRIFLPRCGITISTREPAALRDHLIPLGVTKMSAGVTTAVGGHTIDDDANVGQFDICDPRSVEEMCDAIIKRGWQPVFKDWEPFDDAAFG